MFKRNRDEQQAKATSAFTPTPCILEPLEDRRLLSASLHAAYQGWGGDGGAGVGVGLGYGRNVTSIQFSQAPSSVQTGLTALATKDNVTAPTATTTVYLGNQRGVETYTIDISATGTDTRLTVDQNGKPVTSPSNSSTTFGAVPSAVSTEINKIASAQSLTAPASTDAVRVTTPASGAAVYTVRLTSSSSSSGHHAHGEVVSVDANGNPVGNQSLPFDALPTAIQDGLNTNRPSGATALDASTSTQAVRVRTANGITTYSTNFTTSGTSTTVTVDSTGTLAKLPSYTTAQFSTIPQAAQTELQTLATANGVTATIAATQSVNVYDEANGTTIYSVTLPASKTGSTGQTYAVNVTVSVDQAGNPTTPPQNGGEAEGDGGFAGGFGGGFGDRFGRFTGTSIGSYGFFGRAFHR